jgi:hypothetical protein
MASSCIYTTLVGSNDDNLCGKGVVLSDNKTPSNLTKKAVDVLIASPEKILAISTSITPPLTSMQVAHAYDEIDTLTECRTCVARRLDYPHIRKDVETCTHSLFESIVRRQCTEKKKKDISLLVFAENGMFQTLVMIQHLVSVLEHEKIIDITVHVHVVGPVRIVMCT